MKIHQISYLFLFIVGMVSCNQAQHAHEIKMATSAHDIKKPTGETIEKVVKTEAEWREQLGDLEFNVLREAGTERSFSGEYWDNKAKGTYVCRGCQFPLFESATKFKSGTGWPSFFQPLNDYCIAEKKDDAYGWNRVEVLCARCDGHLGHVFEDGPKPTGLRYCINSVSLQFIEE